MEVYRDFFSSDFCGPDTVYVDQHPVIFSSPAEMPEDSYWNPPGVLCTWEMRTVGHSAILVEILDLSTHNAGAELVLHELPAHGANASWFSLTGLTKIRSLVFDTPPVVVTFGYDISHWESTFRLLLHGTSTYTGPNFTSLLTVREESALAVA